MGTHKYSLVPQYPRVPT